MRIAVLVTGLLILAGCGGGGAGTGASQSSATTSSFIAQTTGTIQTQSGETPAASPTVAPASLETPSPSPSPVAPLPTSSAPTLAGLQLFPADNPWNTDVSSWPVDPASARYLAHMNAGTRMLHADFGSDPTYGIPFVVVGVAQPKVPVSFTWADESDPGPYPIPANAPVEAGSDHHVIVVDADNARLYEMYNSRYVNPGWACDAGAVFDLRSNALRPDYWTSADAAGLPILPGLARFDEVMSGRVNHALRFTVQRTQRAFIHPATHFASSSVDPDDPPMGLRVRLRADFDLGRFHGASLVLLRALQRYGMIVADNGSDWFVSGATDSRWDDADLDQLKTVPASAFEVVQTGAVIR